MLPVTVGCPYNRCSFCSLFRDLSFRRLPLEQIEGELQRVRSVNGTPKTIFLGDGNAFALPAKELHEILALIRRYFPGVERIRSDATVTSILRKSDEELESLARAGYSLLYIGVETGLDDVLTFMHKDHTSAQAHEAVERLHRAGLRYAAHIMTGVAGSDRGLENAEQTAAFLNATQPEHIVNFSMMIHAGTPLAAAVRAGTYRQATELENLREGRRLVELLDPGPAHTFDYDGMHDRIEVRVRGRLLRDRERMLREYDKKIALFREKEPIHAWIEE
jgi:radical SAM superfamily enzyme YgiQ (UPF0313 family)